MHTIRTHWSSHNNILDTRRSLELEKRIDKTRRSTRYRRIGLYFFEQEIRHDLLQKIKTEQFALSQDLTHAEYGALVARSAQDLPNLEYTIVNGLTLTLNDYLFGQGDFLDKDYAQADAAILERIQHELQYTTSAISDMMLELRRTRADVSLAQELQDHKHTYQTLHAWVAEYVGTFAKLPRFVDYFSEWSQGTLDALLKDPDICREILEPRYEFALAHLDAKDVSQYGSLNIYRTSYAHLRGRIGARWARQARYVKLSLSIGIVALSALYGSWSLIVLPLVWGMLASARASSQYLNILEHRIISWYYNFEEQLREYTLLYDAMTDPQASNSESIQAEQTLTRRFDAIPFAGEPLESRDAKTFARELYTHVMNFTTSHDNIRHIAQIIALDRRSRDQCFSLFLTEDMQHAEQILYRLSALSGVVQQLYSGNVDFEVLVEEYYQQYTTLCTTKSKKFTYWTMQHSIGDGTIVATSSATLGWLGVYLWNRDAGSASALAASPSAIAQSSVYSDILWDQEDVIVGLERVMSSLELDEFLHTIQHNPSDSLWDALVQMFGEQQGNSLTNELMDMRWRISDDQLSSNLFDQALQRGLPVSPQDDAWEGLVGFLRQIYDYDNLGHYSELIDQPWLSQTLQALQAGSMDMQEFSALSVEQREIVTQAMFRHLDTEGLQEIFAGIEKSDQGSGSLDISGGGGVIHTGSEGVFEGNIEEHTTPKNLYSFRNGLTIPLIGRSKRYK